MYTSFFGLNEKPFTITPDPRYLFMSERHGEGLAHLVYGVTEGGGFIQLTGEVGTGKTTLVRTLLGQIPAEVDIALILNPQLSALEFLLAICEELGIVIAVEDKKSAKSLVDALNQHLLDAHSRGRRVILLVDEAQNLSAGVLEQLRLLTNLETARQKLLQIILIAQPELREKLAQENLRQLAQRITGRYHLEPLSADEASRYIDHRLRVAGALTEIFNPAAKREVFRLSGGVPRIMNVICDRALLGAYTREERTIDKPLVTKAAAEVSGQTTTPMLLKWALPIIGVVTLSLATFALWPNVDDKEVPTNNTRGEIPVASVVEEAAATVAESPPPKLDINSLLSAHDDFDSFKVLFDQWNVDYDAIPGTACEQAIAADLRCYFQRGSWTTLLQLDRPALITLTGNDGASWQVALIGLTETDAQLLIDGSEITVPVADLAHYWFGQFMILWRPPNANEQQIGPGTRSPNVVWLRESLAEIDKRNLEFTADGEVFDDQLATLLIEFQRGHRLDADGIAGLKTQIIINSMLESNQSPRLKATR
ncbi:MAG: AAA family ATPase [Woeseia sp.]|jgi:general secretion pathway protein A|nr:AAA family ATPase [Woeseia sp.]MBT6210279.1 AAA family ATPase [Woeseia sp.]